ncbi:unnamed protein product [Linum trigynum]|uniref:Uncharacterized protein n=1 Tax=Linum trigynum TaxID=586398 RepID=A0AAV2CT49_9ROSI
MKERTSIPALNKNGDNGSPCLRPLFIPKKPVASPLTKTESFVEETSPLIHLRNRMKPYTLQGPEDAVPGDGIKGLLNIELNDNARHSTTTSTINNFISDKA